MLFVWHRAILQHCADNSGAIRFIPHQPHISSKVYTRPKCLTVGLLTCSPEIRRSDSLSCLVFFFFIKYNICSITTALRNLKYSSPNYNGN